MAKQLDYEYALDEQEREEGAFTHRVVVENDQATYYIAVPSDWTLQQLADDFLADYYIDPEFDDNENVQFSIEDLEGKTLACFFGRPDEVAKIGFIP